MDIIFSGHGHLASLPDKMSKISFGPYIEDIDDNMYIDYISSFGPLIFGHGRKEIINAAKEALDLGTTYGACHVKEVKLAKIISELMPSMEMLRLTSSGTEATMSAIRAARGFTAKDKVIKFEGCYHGHIDHLLVSAGSGASTFGEPFSKGVLLAGHPLHFVEFEYF